jgi:hypothetical protein
VRSWGLNTKRARSGMQIIADGFTDECVCVMFMCALLTGQGGYERHIHVETHRFYRCLALASTVIVAHLGIADGGMAIGAVSGSSDYSCRVSRPCELPLQFV